jgi:glycosyltransferase involved in cell wall biosynthesis
MKVLLLNTLYYPYSYGGAEKSVQTLAENLVLSGEEVQVITLGENNKRYDLNGVGIWSIKIKNKYWPFSENEKSRVDKFFWHLKDVRNKSYVEDLNKIIQGFGPDIIHTNNLSGFSPHVWSIAKKQNIKIVHTLRDYYLQCPSATKFKNNKICTNTCIDCYYLSIIKKKASQNVDCVVGISDFILKDHIREGYFSNSQQEVIYNGFEIEIRENKQKDMIDNKKIIFGFIGQINTSKGIEVLIESFNNLLEFENWSLVIAGRINDNYKNKLLKICKSDRIKFIGFTDPEKFYKKIHVVIVPSVWNEPFGRVVIEAAIKGKIILGSETGGIPELLINNKDFIFKPNSKELTITLKSFLNNPVKLDVFKMEHSFLSRFQIQNTVFSYKSLYRSLLEK